MVGPRDLSAGLAVLRDAENARLSRQQAVNAGVAPPGVELDVDTVNSALQVTYAVPQLLQQCVATVASLQK